MRRQVKRAREREQEERVSRFEMPEVPLSHLREMLGEIDDVIAHLRPSRESADLRARLRQADVAIEVCHRLRFAPGLRNALTAKVLDLQTQALVQARVERQMRAIAEPRQVKRRAAR